MARQLALFINYEGSEDAKRRFLWNLAYDEDTEFDDDYEGPRGPDEFESMDDLVAHAKERAKNGDFHVNLPGVWDMAFPDFTDGHIFIEAEDDDHYNLLTDFAADYPVVYVNSDVTVTISLDGEYYCGMEHFKYRNGSLIEQWFENDRRESGVWTSCLISWKGTEDAVQALLDDITAENSGCDLFEREEQHWRGKRLNLDAYYEETGPYMRCAICDGEIADDHIGFDAYCVDDHDTDGEKEGIAGMFSALAAAHPALAFEMKMQPLGFDGFKWVKYFSYQDGGLVNERKSEDPKDGFKSGSRDEYYRFSPPLDAAEAAEAGTEAILALAKRDGQALQFLPAAAWTAELCRAVVEADGWALKYVPEHFKTAEVCRIAVENYGGMLQYVPETQKTETLCLAAIADKQYALNFVPPDFWQSKTFCIEAVKVRSAALEYVPDAIKGKKFLNYLDYSTAFEELAKHSKACERVAGDDSATAVYNRGVSYINNMGDFILAYSDFLRAAELDPDNERFSDSISRIKNDIAGQKDSTLYENADDAMTDVKKEPHALCHVVRGCRTPEVCRASIENNGYSIKYVPSEIITPELCRAAVTQVGDALGFVPGQFKSPELCLIAVQRNGYALRSVPATMITAELCLSAVQRTGKALEYVPDALRTAELCLAAVQRNGDALEYVPEPLKTPEICLAAVQRGGDALEYVPEPLRTPEICLAAVQRGGSALEYVPEPMKTPELCLAAVQKKGSALEYVPESMKTPELCLAAVQKNGKALEYVPEPMKAPELCLAAVLNAGLALEYVPEPMKTPELCLAAVQRHGGALEDVPDALKTKEICLEAVRRNKYVINDIPENLRTAEVYFAQALQVGDNFDINEVPENLREKVITLRENCSANDWFIAVQHNGSVFSKVPDDMKTAELCLAAVQNGVYLDHVPEKFLTAEICRAAFEQNEDPFGLGAEEEFKDKVQAILGAAQECLPPFLDNRALTQ